MERGDHFSEISVDGRMCKSVYSIAQSVIIVSVCVLFINKRSVVAHWSVSKPYAKQRVRVCMRTYALACP
jgi:hypothetical protein